MYQDQPTFRLKVLLQMKISSLLVRNSANQVFQRIIIIVLYNVYIMCTNLSCIQFKSHITFDNYNVTETEK